VRGIERRRESRGNKVKRRKEMAGVAVELGGREGGGEGGREGYNHEKVCTTP